MKNRKLSGLMLTPLAIIIVVAAVVLGAELLFMALLHEFLIPMLPFISHTAWDAINAVTTTALVSPALYFLMFRPLSRQQAELENARKKINEAFQEWIAALDAVNDPIFLHDKDFRILRCNKAYQRCAGLPFRQIIGQTYYTIFPKDHEPLPSCLRAMEKAEEAEEEEEEVTAGAAIYRSRAYSIHDEQGAYLYSVHTLEDITISRRAEVALHESEEKFRKITESAQDAIIMMGADRRISFWNTAATRIFGYMSEEALGKEMHTLIAPPQAHAAFAQGFTHFQATGEGPVIGKVIEVSALRKGGEEFPVELSISATRLNGQWHAIGIVRDITERKQAQATQLFLAESGYASAGENFFQLLARYLAQTLKMDYVCIDRLEGDQLSAQTVAIYSDGEFEDNVSYTLKDTPCGEVVAKKVCCFSKGVRQLFPQDAALQKLLAESYVGTTLFGFDGKPIGLIAVIGRQPLADPRLAESLLQMVSVRTVGELERKQAEAQLAEQLEELRGWHDVTLSREMRVIELKHEVDELLGQAGQPPRYPSVESDDQQEK